MYTEQPQLFAAVRSSHFASAAFAATDIRFDGASIPRAESSRILGHFHYFARKFVTQYTWVCVYGVPSGKSMEIASTNPNSMNAGEEALVVGGGPIGLAACQFAEAVGAKVAVIEINDWRRHFASRDHTAHHRFVPDHALSPRKQAALQEPHNPNYVP